MKNLEQIRARNALSFSKGGSVSGKDGGDVIKKIPPLIQNHGLLATMAYSFVENEGWQKVFDAIAKHLADPEVAVIPASPIGGGVWNRSSLMEYLTGRDGTSALLKQATNETMQWLQYARRFVQRGGGNNV